MNKDQLAADGRRYKELGAQIDELVSERQAVSDRLIAELGRRKAASLTGTGGVVVTESSRRIGFDVDRAREVLRPGVFRAATVRVVDGDLLEEQRKAGKVTKEEISSIERRSRKFPKVTLPKVEAA